MARAKKILVPEKFVLNLHSGTTCDITRELIEEEFPRLRKLEEGAWYYSKLIKGGRALIRYAGEGKGLNIGFTHEGEWTPRVGNANQKHWKKAPIEDVKKALKKEAKKRGFGHNNISVVSLLDNRKRKILQNTDGISVGIISVEHGVNDLVVYTNNWLIFDNDRWAQNPISIPEGDTWYYTNSDEDKPRSLIYYKSGNAFHCGFDSRGDWGSLYHSPKTETDWVKAPAKDLVKALTKEAIKRGLTQSVEAESPWCESKFLIGKTCDFGYIPGDEEDDFCTESSPGDYYTLMRNGEWARPIEAPVEKVVEVTMEDIALLKGVPVDQIRIKE